MSGDVLTEWQQSNFNSSSFPTAVQSILATQNVELVSQLGHFDPNEEFIRALVNAVNEALGG
jgi:hypothetical protein